MKDQILKILKKHENLTFPGGVGSSFRCINELDYVDVAEEIVSLLKSEELSLIGK
jgi:hypothetical protein